MNEQCIYRAAMAAWGADAQTLMVFEEMAELQKELCKAARGKDNREQIAEEIADVELEKGNEPLTLAELSELKGKPVVVLPIGEGKSAV